MADMGIRRPVEFEGVFEKLRKGFEIAERFTEIVVLSAYAGFHFERLGDGPFHKPVEWQYFSGDERNRLFVLAVAQTKRSAGAPNPGILSKEHRSEMFKLLERLVHGGLLEMRDRNVFSNPTEEGYGQGLTTFVQGALRAEEGTDGQVKVQDLLRELHAYGTL